MKKVLTWLLLCILLLQLCPASLADTAIPAKAKTQFNIRTEASTDADRVANVPLGATVNILSYEEDGVWCRVQYRSKEGYAKVIVKNIDSHINMILDVITTQLYTVEESYPKFIKIIEK